MVYLALKWMLSAVLIVAVSELAKRSGWLGGLVASLPIVSVLALIWVFQESKSEKAVMELSYSTALFVIPSFLLFLTLPLLIKRGVPFYGALALASCITMAGYLAFSLGLQRLGIKL